MCKLAATTRACKSVFARAHACVYVCVCVCVCVCVWIYAWQAWLIKY
jgi:cell division septal protein FtsQ